MDYKSVYKPNGVIKSTYDERDYKISELVQKAIDLPKEYINPTPLIILDQGQVGCCVACAGSQAKHIIEYNQTGDNKQFSPMYLYGNRKDDDWQGEGMMPREYLQNLKEYGVCHKEDFDGYFDYPIAKEKYKEKKTWYNKLAFPNRISSYYRLWNYDDIKTAIYTLGSAFISYDVYNCLYAPDKDGKIKYDTKKKYKSLGGHQMLAIGWNEYGLIICNSWGDNFGKNGLINMPYDYECSECWAMVDNIIENEVRAKYKLSFKDKLVALFKK